MNGNRLRSLIDNEKEWRRFVVKEVVSLRKEVSNIQKDIGGLRVWVWINRTIVGTVFAALGYLFNKHIGDK